MLTDRDTVLRRLHELRSEHRDLDTVIVRLSDQGPIDQLQLQRLKKRKLMLKDEIAWLESRLIPDSIACTDNSVRVGRSANWRHWSVLSWAASPTGRSCGMLPRC